MTDLEVVGLQTLTRLSRDLRAAGEQGKGLKRELSRGISATTKETRAAMRSALAAGLPQSGGLAAEVTGSTTFSTQTSLGSQSVGVRIKARGRRSIRRMNATGAFRHPVFGRREVWVTQIAGPPTKGFLDKPFEASRPEIQQEVLLAIGRIRAQRLSKRTPHARNQPDARRGK